MYVLVFIPWWFPFYSVYIGLIIDFTQLSTQVRARVRCTSIEHDCVVLLQMHVFVSTVTSWKKPEGSV